MSGIVIDIDGVVADSEDFLIHQISTASGKPVTFKTPRTFQFYVECSSDDLLRYINEAIINFKHVIPVKDHLNTYVALKILQLRDGRVNFLSSRSNGPVEDATRFWLDQNFPTIPYTLNNIGDMASKFEWMKANGFDAIVDDRFRTCNECDFDNGLTFLVNQEWNQGRREGDHVNRVDNLYEAVTKYIKWTKKS